MRLITLSTDFYKTFPRAAFPEILEKDNRPYYCISIKVDTHTFAIPLRHNIHHPFSFKTVGDAGLDFTKAVLVDNQAYISSTPAWIDTTEWNILKANENKIFFEFRKYLRQYKRAAANPKNPRSQKYLNYTSLKYFKI